MRLCNYCKKIIDKGRSDKKFCNNLCRQHFWQRLNPRFRREKVKVCIDCGCLKIIKK